MAETPVEKRICQFCGAEIRPGSAFCYSCGKAVAAASNGPTAGIRKPEGSLTDFRKESNLPKAAAAGGAGAESKLKAASMRQKSTAQQRKAVEVVWEKQESAPNLWFILASLVLVLFAVLILMAMLHIR